jgi:hypothetical protein
MFIPFSLGAQGSGTGTAPAQAGAGANAAARIAVGDPALAERLTEGLLSRAAHHMSEAASAGGFGPWAHLILVAAALGAVSLFWFALRHAVLLSYLLAQPARPIDGLGIGLGLGVTNTLFGMAVGVAAHYVLEVETAAAVGELLPSLGLVSGAAGMIVGVVLLVRKAGTTLRDIKHFREYRLLGRLGRVSRTIPGHEHDPASKMVEDERRKLMAEEESKPILRPLLVLAAVRPSLGAAALVVLGARAERLSGGLIAAGVGGVGLCVFLALVLIVLVLARERLFELLAVHFGRAVNSTIELVAAIALLALSAVPLTAGLSFG